jgi:hypothetical protein
MEKLTAISIKVTPLTFDVSFFPVFSYISLFLDRCSRRKADDCAGKYMQGTALF